MNTTKMHKVRITVVRIVNHYDLSELYENKIEHTCMYHEKDSFISIDGKKPDGFCSEAWKSIEPFAISLANGIGNFFDGWMKDPYTACISCNDGFRPVSFLLEMLD